MVEVQVRGYPCVTPVLRGEQGFGRSGGGVAAVISSGNTVKIGPRQKVGEQRADSPLVGRRCKQEMRDVVHSPELRRFNRGRPGAPALTIACSNAST